MQRKVQLQHNCIDSALLLIGKKRVVSFSKKRLLKKYRRQKKITKMENLFDDQGLGEQDPDQDQDPQDQDHQDQDQQHLMVAFEDELNEG